MAGFIPALLGGLVSAAGTLVGRVLISLGVSYVVLTGVDASINYAKAEVFAGLSGAPATIVAVFSALKVGTVLNILFSALVGRMVVAGLTNGSLKRMVLK